MRWNYLHYAREVADDPARPSTTRSSRLKQKKPPRSRGCGTPRRLLEF